MQGAHGLDARLGRRLVLDELFDLTLYRALQRVAPPGPPGDPRSAHSDRDAPLRVLAGVLRPEDRAARSSAAREARAPGGPRAALRGAGHSPDPGGHRGLRGPEVPGGVETVRGWAPRPGRPGASWRTSSSTRTRWSW